MPVTDFATDRDALTLTITAEFDAPVARVWQLYADPRQLERVWGPPEYPATFVDHDLRPGGRVTYFMTGPDGERFGGWWEIQEVVPERRFSFRDGFADPDADFRALEDLPVSQNEYAFEPVAGSPDRTRATYVSRYPSTEALEQVLAMGAEEGSTSALNQIDGFLADQPAQRDS